MKIGILTLPLHTNYGGILQAYALQTVLTRMGNDVVVFDTDNRKSLPLWKMPLSYGKRILMKMLGVKTKILIEQHHNKEFPIISQYTQPFIDKYIHRFVVNNLSTLNESYYDAIVVGSDQIWRPKYYRKIENAFLQFASDWHIRRIAYATSFGTDEWEYSPTQTIKCAELVHMFNAVSVRESSGVKLCRDYFDVEAQHVLDPTMLLTADDYKALVENTNIEPCEGDLGCYFLDETEQKTQLIERLADDSGMTTFYINSRVEDKNAPLEERIQPPVERWLRGFLDAKLIVTDSFHVCVFSILFNKPFVTIANESRGNARFLSLLSLFGLERCLYSETWTPDNINSIDWNCVNHRLTDWRKLSWEYLYQINKSGK